MSVICQKRNLVSQKRNVSQIIEDNHFQPRNLHPTKLSLKNTQSFKSLKFSVKEKLIEFVSCKIFLWKILRWVLMKGIDRLKAGY